MDDQAFTWACTTAIAAARREKGIGTLGEKTLHHVLKYYYEPDTARHEVRVGRYIADAVSGYRIVEIQTRQLFRLLPKLDVFLPLYEVKVVLPAIHEKWIIWVDPVSGAMSKKRRSTAVFKPALLLAELDVFLPFIRHPGFSIDIPILAAEEFRLLDGYGAQKKKRATRYETIPYALHSMLTLAEPEDFRIGIPDGLPERFTSRDVHRAAKIPRSAAQRLLRLLYALQLVERTDRDAEGYWYRIKKNCAQTPAAQCDPQQAFDAREVY